MLWNLRAMCFGGHKEDLVMDNAVSRGLYVCYDNMTRSKHLNAQTLYKSILVNIISPITLCSS